MPVANAFGVQLLTNHAMQMPAWASFRKLRLLKSLAARKLHSIGLESVAFLCNFGYRLAILACVRNGRKGRASNCRQHRRRPLKHKKLQIAEETRFPSAASV